MTAWVDFKELRSKLDFEKVLQHYGVEVKRKGDQHQGFCPLPGHNGQRKSPSFSANIPKGICQCFGCGSRGNILDFCVLMEKESPDDGRAVRRIAFELQKKFCGAPRIPRKGPTETKSEAVEQTDGQAVMDAIVNEPLDFELKGLDPAHPYLLGRGFASETIAHFGLGFCARGSLAGRVAIPLHRADGRLIGYAGRVIDDSAISGENPKYRLPSKRERQGKVLDFRKSLFLYNGHRIGSQRDNIAVVEGFCSVWWLHQHGFPCVVATMGADCSKEHANLITALVKPAGRVWIMPDGDKAGERLAHSLLAELSPHRFVRWARLAEGRQPTDLSMEELRSFIPSDP